MSVATKNPFALLDDDEAPSAPVTTEEPAPAPPPAARGDASQKSRGGPASRGGKYYARGGKPQSKDTPPVTEEANKPANDARGERRGRGRGRGGRGGRGGDPNYRGRPFDRHSQTGQTDSDKKINQSWGGADGNTEFETETAAKVDAVAEVSNEWGADSGAAAAGDWGGAAETSADAWATPAADAPAPAAEADAKPEGRPRREREPEEDDNTLTLDQYLAQQKEKDTVIPKLENTRKANEGADDNWKDVVPLAKNEEEDSYFVGKSKTYKARPKKEEKVYLEIDARFDRPDRGGGRGRGRGDRGDRGGDYRGGDRGRGPRGGRGGPRTGGRQNGGNAPAVNVDDPTAFPSLS